MRVDDASPASGLVRVAPQEPSIANLQPRQVYSTRGDIPQSGFELCSDGDASCKVTRTRAELC